MDFQFTPEQEKLRQEIRDFAKVELTKELARQLDELEEFPLELLKKMADMGWIGIPFAREYGGAGGNEIDMVILLEELARAMIAANQVMGLCVSFSGKSIQYYGTEEQKERYLPRIIKGDLRISLAVTEPGGGTDVLGALRTEAVEDGDAYIINGSKIFISGAHMAQYMITVVRTDPTQRGAKGITLFLVPTDTPGVEMRRLKKLGIKATGTNEIFFNDVRVPKENILGQLNNGWYHVVNTLNNERIFISAASLGAGLAAIDELLEFAKTKEIKGRPVGAYQVNQHRIAEIITQIEAARLLVYRAAWLQSAGQPCGLESTMAKYFAAEAGFRATQVGMDIMGDYGYSMNSAIQRNLRDAELWLMAPISNEMCKNFIGQSIGLPRSF
ncbi:MAG: acyl-CoA dehydrogenase family protein [Pseudomonadota bacterium]